MLCFDRWVFGVAFVVAGCGPRVPADDAGAGQSGGSTSIAESTVTDATASRGGSTLADDSAGADGVSSSGTSEPKIDLAAPTYVCPLGVSQVEVVDDVVPWGSFPVEHAHFGRDACSPAPFLILSVEPITRDPSGWVVTPAERIEILIDAYSEGNGYPTVLEGEYPARFDAHGPMGSSAEGSVSFHEPFAWLEEPPQLSARVTASAPGWQFVADLVAERCDSIGTCSCPCE